MRGPREPSRKVRKTFKKAVNKSISAAKRGKMEAVRGPREVALLNKRSSRLGKAKKGKLEAIRGPREMALLKKRKKR